MIKVFVTNLRKYNEGYLSGKYINLPMDEDELKEEVDNILGIDEEYFISDSEAPFYIDAYESVFELNKWLQEVTRHCDNLNAIVLMLGEFNNRDEVLGILESGEYRIWSTSNMSEIAREFLEETIPNWNELPDIIHRHFDYDSYGDELSDSYLIDSNNNITVQIYR